MMSIYWDKIAYVQVIVNSPYSVAQLCTHEDALACILGILGRLLMMSCAITRSQHNCSELVD